MSRTFVNATEIIHIFRQNHNNFVQQHALGHRIFDILKVQMLFRKALTDSIDSRCYWAKPLGHLDSELNRLFPEIGLLESMANTLRDNYITQVLDQLLVGVEKFTDSYIPTKTWRYVDIIQKGCFFSLQLGEDFRVLEYHRLHGGNPW